METYLEQTMLELDVQNEPTSHLISDKIIYPKSKYFGKKGESYYLKGDDQWYFLPKGEERVKENFIRVPWYYLEGSVGEGSYGEARYKGINASIVGKIGELLYSNRKWIFVFDGEKYTLNSPDSVELLSQ